MFNPPTTTNATEDPKYTVAELLSSLASGEPSMTPTSLAFMSTGPSTITTPTLTPNTLRTLESALASVADYPTTTTTTTISANQRESGFIPPLIDPVASSAPASMVKQEFPDWYQEDSSFSEDSEWADSPAVKRVRGNDGLLLNQGFTAAGATYGTSTTTKASNRRGGRRLNDSHLTPEEAQRRNVRRERNKLAAAKCRQRRVDLTNTLINESDVLEEEQSKLENDIQNLQQQKEQLEFLLEAHRPVCTAKVAATNEAAIKHEKEAVAAAYVTNAVTTATGTVLITPPEAHKNVVSTQGLSILNMSISNAMTSRPSTLPIFPKKKKVPTATLR